jgi:UDP-N-acetylglucosamine transferase subunit ALG13
VIFVTVGTHSQGLDRLIKKMDEIAGKIDEEVVMQIGSTKYRPKNARYFDFIEDFEKIKELNRKARVVVCHGGAGTIITALDEGAPVIAVPRLKEHGEHINDHQLELVDALSNNGKILAVYDIDLLEETLSSPFVNSHKKSNGDSKIVRAMRNYLDGLN